MALTSKKHAPVAKHYSLRLIMAIVAAKDLEIIQLDVKTAFLYGDLQEEIYMAQPEGFVIPGKEEAVCRLIKSLYGLKQASRAWNQKFKFPGVLLINKNSCRPMCVLPSSLQGGNR